MVLTHLGGCTLVTSTLGDGSATTHFVSVPDSPTAEPAGPASPGPGDTPPSAGPGATPAPFSEPSPVTGSAPGVSLALRPRGRGRMVLG